jgi:hypothetical protein
MPKVNWDDANQSSLIPDGKYLCQVKNVIERFTKTGKEMWTIVMSVESEGPYFQNILYHNLVFGESSLWMVKMFYEAALSRSLTGESECDPSDLKDTYLFVHVKGKKLYEGKDQPILSYFESVRKKEETDEIPF